MAKLKTIFYFAATRYEGCGHRHRKPEVARKCLRRVTGPRKGIYAVVSVPTKAHPTAPFKSVKVEGA